MNLFFGIKIFRQEFENRQKKIKTEQEKSVKIYKNVFIGNIGLFFPSWVYKIESKNYPYQGELLICVSNNKNKQISVGISVEKFGKKPNGFCIFTLFNPIPIFLHYDTLLLVVSQDFQINKPIKPSRALLLYVFLCTVQISTRIQVAVNHRLQNIITITALVSTFVSVNNSSHTSYCII